MSSGTTRDNSGLDTHPGYRAARLTLTGILELRPAVGTPGQVLDKQVLAWNVGVSLVLDWC